MIGSAIRSLGEDFQNFSLVGGTCGGAAWNRLVQGLAATREKLINTDTQRDRLYILFLSWHSPTNPGQKAIYIDYLYLIHKYYTTSM